MTVVYITSRTTAMRSRSLALLALARERCDSLIDEFVDWSAPLASFQSANGSPPIRYKSRDMFRAFLDQHRRRVIVGLSYFVDETRFYADVISDVIHWQHSITDYHDNKYVVYCK